MQPSARPWNRGCSHRLWCCSRRQARGQLPPQHRPDPLPKEVPIRKAMGKGEKRRRSSSSSSSPSRDHNNQPPLQRARHRESPGVKDLRGSLGSLQPTNERQTPPQHILRPPAPSLSMLTTQQPEQVGGKLSSYWQKWEQKGAHPSVVSMLRWGYRIPLKENPELTTVPKISSGYSSSVMDIALEQAIRALEDK